jgi:hypothetical protein
MIQQRSGQTSPVDAATGASLYDLFDNPNGPSYNELWAAFASRHPTAASKLLRFANACGQQAGDQTVAEAVLMGAVRAAGYCDNESEHSPAAHATASKQLESLFTDSSK